MSNPGNELVKDGPSLVSDEATPRPYKFSVQQVENIKKSLTLLSQSYSVPKDQLDENFVRFLIEIGAMPPDEPSIHPLFGMSKAKNDFAKINIDIKKMADQISKTNGIIDDHFQAVSKVVKNYSDLTTKDSPIQKLLYSAIKDALDKNKPDQQSEKQPALLEVPSTPPQAGQQQQGNKPDSRTEDDQKKEVRAGSGKKGLIYTVLLFFTIAIGAGIITVPVNGPIRLLIQLGVFNILSGSGIGVYLFWMDYHRVKGMFEDKEYPVRWFHFFGPLLMLFGLLLILFSIFLPFTGKY
jgi:hypothetical protein